MFPPVLPTLQIISFSSTPPIDDEGLMIGTLTFEVLIPPTPGYPQTTRTFKLKYCTNLFSTTVRTSKPIPTAAPPHMRRSGIGKISFR